MINDTEIIATTMEAEKQNLFRYACYRVGNPDDAEDILQDLFLTLCSQKGLVQNTVSLKNYIYRCIVNNCNSHLRHKQKDPVAESVGLEDLQIENIAPQNFEEEYAIMEKLLQNIPAEQSEVIRLHIHGNRTFGEIAEILGLPEATAKSRYRYGIEKLRDGFKKQNLI